MTLSQVDLGGNLAELSSQILEWESKYAVVVEENENLLLGMHNILEKLRNYDGEYERHCSMESYQLTKVYHSKLQPNPIML